MIELSASEVAELRNAGEKFTLLDVREPIEVKQASIEGAVVIPMREVPSRMDELPRDERIVVMCHHGGRSEKVAAYLLDAGFTNVANLSGGIDEWSRDVDAQVPRY